MLDWRESHTVLGSEYFHFFTTAGAAGPALAAFVLLAAFFAAGAPGTLVSAVASGAFLFGGILTDLQDLLGTIENEGRMFYMQDSRFWGNNLGMQGFANTRSNRALFTARPRGRVNHVTLLRGGPPRVFPSPWACL